MSAFLTSLPDFSWVLQPSGIYFLLLKGEVQYIGKSTNVAARLSAHRSNLIRHRRGLPPKMTDVVGPVNFDEVRVLFADRDRLDALEIQWVQQFNPPCNTQLNRGAPPPDLKKHAFYQNLLVIGQHRLAEEKKLTALIPKRGRKRPHDKWLGRTRLLRGKMPVHV